MASRFGPSALHQRQSADPRSALFGEYERKTNSVSPGPGAGRPNPYAGAGGYGYGSPAPGAGASGSGGVNGGFRVATPNRKGQYSDAVIDELESQNDEQVEGMSARVKMLKDITVAIGDEIRDSSALADKMNDGFESARTRVRGTMTRMLRMAERTGVGWRVWLGFFAAVGIVFWWVWIS